VSPISEQLIFELHERGQHYKLRAHPESHIGKSILRHGKPYESRLLDAIADEGLRGHAIDAGAHIGNHTIYFACVLGLSVTAFEPRDVSLLMENIDLNGLDRRSINVMKMALSDRVGWLKEVSAGKFEPSEDIDADAHLELVPCAPLDAFELEDVALIKIDVEDMEPRVLVGGEMTIKRWAPMLLTEARDAECLAAIEDVVTPWGYRNVKRHATATPVYQWEVRA
jgi:FkbM family methyltransferase